MKLFGYKVGLRGHTHYTLFIFVVSTYIVFELITFVGFFSDIKL